jgi:hypothetical protein
MKESGRKQLPRPEAFTAEKCKLIKKGFFVLKDKINQHIGKDQIPYHCGTVVVFFRFLIVKIKAHNIS